MTGQTRAINCTNCGAGLPVLGGGRVNTQVCGYCGAALDANDAYRVLKVWDGMERPSSPFRLGMTGEIEGVPFTVIGTLGKQEKYKGRVWEWVDHQLFSPTHGYAWLTVEDGHCLLTRKLRDGPMEAFVTSHQVELASWPPRLTWKGSGYRYYSTTNWETTYVEGEFNWRPERGRRGTTVSLMSDDPDDGMLGFTETVGSEEREIERSHLWPEAQTAFGVTDGVKPRGDHPLMDIRPTFAPVMSLWFLLMALAAGVLGIAALGLEAPPQVLFRGDRGDLPAQLTFTATDTGRPAQLELHQQLQNAFAGYEVRMTAPDGTALADTYREISYYSGGSGDDSWSEGSRSQTLQFTPPAVGAYDVVLTPDPTGEARGRLTVTFTESLRATRWLWIATAVFVVAAILNLFTSFKGGGGRWAGSDWSED